MRTYVRTYANTGIAALAYARARVQRAFGKEKGARGRDSECVERGAMPFVDEFMPSDGEDDFALEMEVGEDLLVPTDGESSGEVEFVPPGGSQLAPAAAASSISAVETSSGGPGKQQRTRAGQAAVPTTTCDSKVPRKRKLVRLVSNPKPESPVAQLMLCIAGKPLKNPVPVYPIKIDSTGKPWVTVNEHQDWSRRACASTGTTHYEVHFQAALTALRENIVELIEAERKKETAAGQQDMIRESLNLSDSEDEAGSRKTFRKHEDAQTDCQVTVEGVSVRVLNQLRPVCLECTAPALSALVAACKRLTEEHAAAPAANKKPKGSERSWAGKRGARR